VARELTEDAPSAELRHTELPAWLDAAVSNKDPVDKAMMPSAKE
jgi:hypothetical protein